MTEREKLSTAMDLLSRADEMMSDYETAPDQTWYKEYLTLLGGHWIHDGEGWCEGGALADYRKDDPDWQPADEIGSPEAV